MIEIYRSVVLVKQRVGVRKTLFHMVNSLLSYNVLVEGQAESSLLSPSLIATVPIIQFE